MKLLFSHPAGNQNVRAMLDGLEAAGMLARFTTTLAVAPDNPALKLVPQGLSRDLLRRRFNIPREKILQHPWRELARAVCSRAGWNYWLRHEQGFASIDGVLQDFDRFSARALPRLHRRFGLGAVYTYEDSALDTFKAARALGVKCVYDLPISYWEVGRRLMEEEIQRLPAWRQALGGGMSDSPAKLERKAKELELADLVVVPSRFVADSLPAWAGQKTRVLSPFGSPLSAAAPAPKTVDPSKPLRVLFVGSMGQRKGLADLFQAMQLLKGENIELVVMGSLLADLDFYRGQYAGFTHEKGRPHPEVLALMRSCDVFCLPSLYEGRALVMQEAMSQGLPIVITPNTGGDDLVVEGKTGFLVPIRSPEKIAEKLAWFNQNRQALPAMSEAAVQHAASYTWKGYSEVVIDAIRKLG
ncbi:glycosyltransferase family 4 protein [Variovorax sp. JS1663]|uniref:glycosyltransferase family 4 protein n=1 Tax=Variovorax sp. JS1663 TaxID=1851577 RepID=UPI000B348A6A|nr:glycosyltransferase [Variovorax sp. JS1663]OUM03093.1 group 1 glycosyl transferase [Variovorax sp. JS1663]